LRILDALGWFPRSTQGCCGHLSYGVHFRKVQGASKQAYEKSEMDEQEVIEITTPPLIPLKEVFFHYLVSAIDLSQNCSHVVIIGRFRYYTATFSTSKLFSCSHSACDWIWCNLFLTSLVRQNSAHQPRGKPMRG